MGREEERGGMGGVGAKSREDSIKMGLSSCSGGVTSLNSTAEGSANECSSANVSSNLTNMPHCSSELTSISNPSPSSREPKEVTHHERSD